MVSDAQWFNNVENLAALVYVETTRPDLVQETVSAIIASTMKLHSMDFWYKDRQSVKLQFDTSAYIQTVDTQVLPRFRSLGEDGILRKYDPTFAAYELNPSNLPPLQSNSLGIPINPDLALRPLKLIDPDDILDDYQSEKVDVFYNVSGQIWIKSSTSVQYANIIYYAYPIMDVQNKDASPACPAYDSWIAREFPYAIVYDATASLLQKTGNNDAAAAYIRPPDPRTGLGGGLLIPQLINLRLSNTR